MHLKRAMALLAMLLCGIVMLTGCGSDNTKDLLLAAYESAGRPQKLETVQHYRFEGTEELNRNTGTTVEVAFHIAAQDVPQNGHVFIFHGKADIFVLMTETGKVLRSVNLTELSALSSASTASLQAQIKQVNTDYAAGKITNAQMEIYREQITRDSERNMETAEQNLALAQYLIGATGLNVVPTDKAAANKWHTFTDKTTDEIQTGK